MVHSGSYTVQSESFQNVARLTSNNPNAPLQLVDPTGADNETWVVTAHSDGTFVIHNKEWVDNGYAGVSNASSGEPVKAVSASDATRWKRSGTQIVVSGFAWQATLDNKIVLKPVDTADPHQSFDLNTSN